MIKKTALPKPRFVSTAIICLFLTVAAFTAHAQTTKYWIGGNGNWTDPTKWSGGVAPVGGDKAVLNTSGDVSYNLSLSLSGMEITPTGTVIMRLSHAGGILILGGTNSLIVNGTSYEECDIDGTCSTRSNARYVLYDEATLMTAGNSVIGTNKTGEFYHVSGTKTVGQDLILGRDSGSYGYYQLEGGTLTVTGSTILGQTGWGQFYQEAGTHNVGKDLILASVANLANEESVGYYELRGGALNVTGNSIIGAAGYSGWFDHYDGTHTVGANLILGRDAGSWGRYELTAGTLTVNGNSIIGQSGEGQFAQTGGNNAIKGNLYLGRYSSGNGTYNMSGTGNLSSVIEHIGYLGIGSFTQSNGTNTASYLYLGYGGNGSYELSGTGNLSSITEYIGAYGTGIFKQSGGTNMTNYLYIGHNSTGHGTYELSDIGTLTANTEIVGYTGTGTITQSGGTNSIQTTLYLGRYSGANGTYELSNTGNLTADTEQIGHQGTGVFSHSGGINTISNSLFLGRYAGSNGTYNLSNTGYLSSVIEHIGYLGIGTFNQSGGTHNISGTITISNTPGTSHATYNLSGGTLTAATIVNNDQFNYSGGNINTNITNNTSGTFSLSGAGTRVVNGNVSNYGTFKATDTTVSYTGTFENFGAYISDPSSNYFTNLYIGASGYLNGGEGDLFAIAGNFLNYSTSDLWNTEAADLAFAGDAVHNFYLGDAGQTFFWDDLILYGSLNITGDAYLYADELLGLDLTSFTLTGSGRIYFDALNANNAYLLSYTYGYNYLAASYDAVPEPATFILLLSGFLALTAIKSKYRLHA